MVASMAIHISNDGIEQRRASIRMTLDCCFDPLLAVLDHEGFGYSVGVKQDVLSRRDWNDDLVPLRRAEDRRQHRSAARQPFRTVAVSPDQTSRMARVDEREPPLLRRYERGHQCNEPLGTKC